MKAFKSLRGFKPKHKFFVGVDSDGCVFDSMSIKQRECFCPWMIEYFGLHPVAEAVRQCKDFADIFFKNTWSKPTQKCCSHFDRTLAGASAGSRKKIQGANIQALLRMGE